MFNINSDVTALTGTEAALRVSTSVSVEVVTVVKLQTIVHWMWIPCETQCITLSSLLNTSDSTTTRLIYMIPSIVIESVTVKLERWSDECDCTKALIQHHSLPPPPRFHAHNSGFICKRTQWTLLQQRTNQLNYSIHTTSLHSDQTIHVSDIDYTEYK